MHAIVNLVLATSVWALVGHAELVPAINEAGSTPIRDAITVNEICTKIKCQKDFPVSSTRQFAEAEQNRRYGEHQRI